MTPISFLLGTHLSTSTIRKRSAEAQLVQGVRGLQGRYDLAPRAALDDPLQRTLPNLTLLSPASGGTFDSSCASLVLVKSRPIATTQSY